MVPMETSGAGLSRTMPEPCRPIKAIKSPIPAEMAFFKSKGMQFRIASRRLVIVRRMKIRPSRKTAVRANCQEYPMPRQTLNAKKALSPMPGARPTGRLAYSAMIAVAMAELRAVAAKTELASMPAALKILGLTAKIYAIVIKVVIPAKTSVLIVEPFSLILK